MRKLVLAALAILVMENPSSQAYYANVHVQNSLSVDRLIAHCQSKDEDLSAQVIEEGSSLYWRFDPTALGKAQVWCNLAVQDKRLSFTVYDVTNTEIRGDEVRWVVRDDGAHLVLFGNVAEESVARQKWRRIVFSPDTN
ncbi:unnamed protein product [Linum trigynum]|uniref:S-protein homolog n=1 Tax=Linum trigynum TaxID=586398 RepID=A0AAV2D4R1_9ROSI